MAPRAGPGRLTQIACPCAVSTSSVARSGCGASQRSRSPVRDDRSASRSPRRPAFAGANDTANAGGTVLAVPAWTVAVAATGRAEASPEAGVPLAHPATSAAAARVRAVAGPPRAFLTNLRDPVLRDPAKRDA